MEFGICFKGSMEDNRMKNIVQQAEIAGFKYCWFYDSHILWRESFVSMAMCIEHTSTMRFGPCVTNPNTRDWSLAASLFGSLVKQSNGRFDIGVGRGELMPYGSYYITGFLHDKPLAKLRRDLNAMGIQREESIKEIIPVKAPNGTTIEYKIHVADIVEKYGSDTDEVPKSLTSYIKDRKGYDYSKHGESINPFLDFITNDVVESFCVLGEPEDHVSKLKILKECGATQFNIYLDNGDEEKIIADYGEKIIPEFS